MVSLMISIIKYSCLFIIIQKICLDIVWLLLEELKFISKINFKHILQNE